ncbi:MAG: arginine--tRNA ligase [Bacteroidales bacterium]|nr:arginine--tRNA ligase [Bacteroidales bacterium]
MNLNELLTDAVAGAINTLYGMRPSLDIIQLQKTRKDFEGNITLVTFPLLRISKKSPEETGANIGGYLKENTGIVSGFNCVKGFLNLIVSDAYYINFINNSFGNNFYGFKPPDTGAEKIMVEYSSPNTNKPLHLGHIRNNLLGNSLCRILEANGKHVIKTNIVNDRGIHICKSMLAWQKWGNGQTPESSGKKGDHLVGDFYVKFDLEYKKQISELVAGGMQEEAAGREAPIMKEAQEMLRKWESRDSQVLELWEMMNQWVYSGFDVTYKRLGVGFDKIYYESDTYIIGRDTVLEGLKKGVFYQRPDSSVWVDLTKDGLDEKILLRSDGTSVYMTQDIGTAQIRQTDFSPDKMVYVVGNEQNYHFKVLALILDKLGYSWAKGLYHMSYGMVELPEGKMKSREGTVVDADDLMDDMIDTAKAMADELGKLEGLTGLEKEDTYRIIGLGALKYFILKVDPVKNMVFDPRESIDFNGNTGPFIQYTYARIRSVLRKASDAGIMFGEKIPERINIGNKEKSILAILYDFPSVVAEAGNNFSPALIANYIYDLVKEYNQFYHDFSIIKESDGNLRNFRLMLSDMVGTVIKNGMGLLGIEVPERM